MQKEYFMSSSLLPIIWRTLRSVNIKNLDPVPEQVTGGDARIIGNSYCFLPNLKLNEFNFERFRPKDLAFTAINNTNDKQEEPIKTIISDLCEQSAKLKAEIAKEKAINEIKSQSISMVAHEIRSSLTVILAISEMLNYYDNKIDDKDRTKYLEKIKNQVKTMNEILETVLEIGKVELGKKILKKTSVDFANFCYDIWMDVQTLTKTKHRFVFSGNCESVTLSTDKTLLRQILLNLLVNAVKYSPEGNNVYLSIYCEKKEIKFEIKDQGIGIPEQDQEQLFEIFHRASNVSKFCGTGIGLSLVKKLVELHEGQISFASQLGLGTTFTVILPTY